MVSRKIGVWEDFKYFYIIAESQIKGQRSYHSTISSEFHYTLIQISILLSLVLTNTFTFSLRFSLKLHETWKLEERYDVVLSAKAQNHSNSSTI